MVDLTEYLPYKLKGLNFNRISYNLFKEKARNLPSVIVYDETGFVLDINLQQIYLNKFANKKKEDFLIKSFQKEPYDIMKDHTQLESVRLSKSGLVKLNPSELILQRVHDKQISIITKLKI